MVTDELLMIPTPYPDEALCSLVFRYHNAMVGRNLSETWRQITGATRRQYNTYSDKYLDNAIQKISRRLNVTVEDLMHQFTLDTQCLRTHRQGIYWAFWTGVAPKPKLRLFLGLDRLLRPSSPHVNAPTQFFVRYCEACREEDMRNFGVGYWRRAHQWPMVFACHLHGQLLVDDLSILPGDAKHGGRRLSIHRWGEYRTAGATDCQISFARIIAALLQVPREPFYTARTPSEWWSSWGYRTKGLIDFVMDQSGIVEFINSSSRKTTQRAVREHFKSSYEYHLIKNKRRTEVLEVCDTDMHFALAYAVSRGLSPSDVVSQYIKKS